MEFLKSIFGDAALTYDQLAEKLKGSTDVKLANLASGQYVDKGKFDAAQTELTGLREQLKSANESIEGFKKLDAEGLRKAAQEWKDKHAADTAALQEKLKAQAKDSAVRLAVAKENVHDDALTMAALDLGKITVAEDGTVAGLADQLSALRETKPFLFKTGEKRQEYTPAAGGIGKDPKQMNYTELCAYLEANPGAQI
ncbi:phage scaffolding protein [Anaerotruncus massiliensis (ex Liu et al. 2021)]|uniref:phage scaffolding protein n=1 Tax=Anaerotruncus massiliensis (ex Liu et al. 2021) TaxID=2321404 RepID=UPI003AB8C19C